MSGLQDTGIAPPIQAEPPAWLRLLALVDDGQKLLGGSAIRCWAKPSRTRSSIECHGADAHVRDVFLQRFRSRTATDREEIAQVDAVFAMEYSVTGENQHQS